MSSNTYWRAFEEGADSYRGAMFYVKRFIVRLFYGYHESDIWNLHDTLRESVPDQVILYTEWQCEHGRHLPREFANDPAAWAEILRKMGRAWMLLRDGYPRTDDDLQAEVDEGMVLFGRWFEELHG